jgi:hypothetical protein
VNDDILEEQAVSTFRVTPCDENNIVTLKMVMLLFRFLFA